MMISCGSLTGIGQKSWSIEHVKPLSDETPWPLFSVFDIEATSWVDVTRVCHVDEMGQRRHYTTVGEYIDFLFSDDFESDMVWAHWGGRYDHRFIIWETALRSEGKVRKWQVYNWQAMVSGNLIIILVVRDDKGNQIKFCESGRLMPDSVKKIGETVSKVVCECWHYKDQHVEGQGCEVCECECFRARDLHKLEIDRRKIGEYSEQTVIDYCYRDCDIVLEGLKLMRRSLMSANCDFGFTLASIATRFVRRSDALEWWRFYDKVPDPVSGRTKMEYSTAMLQADAFCMPSYFGGRTEVYCKEHTKQRLYYYDITSAYPWAMTQELPAYFKGFSSPRSHSVSLPGKPCVQVQDVYKSLNRCGVSEVSIDMPPLKDVFKFPVLPWRDDVETRKRENRQRAKYGLPEIDKPVGHKVVFPILTASEAWPQGERGRWTNVELMELWEQGQAHGLKIHIHGQALFEPVPFLQAVVNQFFSMRLEAKAVGDEFRTYAYKIFLNSIYGKLIETTVRRSVLFGDDMVTEAIEKFGAECIEESPAPGAYFLTTESEGPFRHVAAGAYVTALARLRLLAGIKTAHDAGAKIYYCDTDSLILDKPVFGMVSEKRLGDFNLECEIIEAEFLASKVYRLVKAPGYYKKESERIVYKAKGMPITADPNTDEDFAAVEMEQRWLQFIAQLKGRQADKPTREGISGFMTDIRAGRLHPKPYAIPRQMRFGDMKRLHLENGDSEPRIWIAGGW